MMKNRSLVRSCSEKNLPRSILTDALKDSMLPTVRRVVLAKISLNSKLVDEKEINAFVQQQLSDLSPHLADTADLELSLSESKKGFQASLTMKEAPGPVQMVGQSQDLFQAIRLAKEGLIEYCVEIQAQSDPHWRRDKISQILNQKSHWIH